MDLTAVFDDYSRIRTPDAHSVCDLALHNYHEMASGVISRGYKMRKMVEDVLYRYVPWTGIIPLYTMVSFGDMRYSEVHKKWVRQGRILQLTAGVSSVVVLLSTGYATRKLLKGK